MAKTRNKTCKNHGKAIFVLRSDGVWRCRRCVVDSVQKRRTNVKAKLVEYFGGVCEICDYSRYIGALQFHYIDPSLKEFELSMGNIKSFKRGLSEAVKCLLVCTRCHDEIHGGIILQPEVDVKKRKILLFKRFNDESSAKFNFKFVKCDNCGYKTKNVKFCSAKCSQLSRERINWPDDFRFVGLSIF